MSEGTWLFPDRSSGRLPVKVCGITRIQDARLAWSLGASALGFIFFPGSPRSIQPEAARALRQRLPKEARCVGVFVDASPEEAAHVVAFVGLTAVQLHGPALDTAAFSGPRIHVVRSEADALASPAECLMLDAALPGRHGGTGLRADWSLAARIARRRPLILAGGIGPTNVLEAFETVQPRAVDVNSAVELAPGIKDGGRLRELFHLVERATPHVENTDTNEVSGKCTAFRQAPSPC